MCLLDIVPEIRYLEMYGHLCWEVATETAIGMRGMLRVRWLPNCRGRRAVGEASVLERHLDRHDLYTAKQGCIWCMNCVTLNWTTTCVDLG